MNSPGIVVIAGVITALFCENGGAVTGLTGVDDAVYRSIAGEEAFSGLVRLSAGSGTAGTSGSGYLLNGSWLVTAAHLTWGREAADFTVTWNGVARVAAAVFYPEEWSVSPSVGLEQGGDFALVRLSEPVAFAKRVPLAESVSAGSAAVFLGNGRGGNGIVGAADSAAARGAMNTIDRVTGTAAGGGWLAMDFDDGTPARNSLNAATVSLRYYDDGFADPRPSVALLTGVDDTSDVRPAAGGLLSTYFPDLPAVAAEGTTARGDSGGPLFVRNAGTGEWDLAGVTSWGFNPTLPDGFARFDSRYGDISFFTDLTLRRDWIASVVPEPSPILTGAAGALFLTLRRSRVRSASPASGQQEFS